MRLVRKAGHSLALGLLLCILITPAASAADAAITLTLPDQSPALLALAFLAPAGFALLAVATDSTKRVLDVALSMLLALALSCAAYFACGFAFQFGGLGLWHPDPAYAPLNIYWSAFGADYGRGWGMVGLRGFGLLDGAGTSAALRLFLAQLPLLTTATMIPLLALRRRVHAIISLLAGLLVAVLVYPVLGNWMWGGGWLSQLGTNLDLGHGALDIGGAGPVHLVGATFALVGIVVLLPRRPARDSQDVPIPLPETHLPALSILGALMLTVGWWAAILAQPLPDWTTLSTELTSMNLLLAAGAGALMAGLYALLAAGRLDFVMVARGLAAGVVAVCAGAPFIATWSALLVGGIAGILVPLGSYFVMEKMRLDDAGIVTIHGVGGIIGLLVPAFFATGLYGAGWNGVGHADHLGVAGQGVTGLLAAAGRQPDWPGQLTAQAAAVGASIIFSGLLAFVLFQAIHRLIRAWQPVTVESRELEVLLEQSAPADEETAPPQVDPCDGAEDDSAPEGKAEDRVEEDMAFPKSDTGEPNEAVVAEESATMPDEEAGEVPDNSGEPAQS